jgi:hypothetical protein
MRPLAATEEVAVGDHATGRDVAGRVGERGDRRPRYLLGDHDDHADAGTVRLPVDVHVGEHARGVQALAGDVEGVGAQGVADRDAGDGTHRLFVGADGVDHADVGDGLFLGRSRRRRQHERARRRHSHDQHTQASGR